MSYSEIDPLLSSNSQNVDQLVENSRRKCYIGGLINLALLIANVNQFKKMVNSSTGDEQTLFITVFSITSALQIAFQAESPDVFT